MDDIKRYNISNIDFMTVPCCPICDCSIDEYDLPAIGVHIEDGHEMYCLIHSACGEENEKVKGESQ